MSLHIYQAQEQPLVGHKVHIDTPFGTKTWTSKTKPQALVYCSKCRTRRRARNLAIRCYYDMSYVYCASGGCAK